MMIGAVLYAGLLLLLSFATQLWQCVAILFLFGCSRNLLNVSVNTQSVGVQALYKRSIINSFHGIWSLAGFAGAALGFWMISKGISTATHFAIAAGLSITLSAVAFPFTLQHDVAGSNRRQSFVWPGKKMIPLGLIAFACMACEGILTDWTGIYFEKEVLHSSSSHLQAGGYVAYMSAMTAGRFAGDWVVNRLDRKKLVRLSGLLIAMGLLITILLPQPLPAIVGFMFTGLGVSCVIPTVFVFAGKMPNVLPGTAIASVSTIGYFGFLLGPPVTGFISEAAGLRWAFAVIAGMGLLIFFLAAKIRQS